MAVAAACHKAVRQAESEETAAIGSSRAAPS